MKKKILQIKMQRAEKKKIRKQKRKECKEKREKKLLERALKNFTIT